MRRKQTLWTVWMVIGTASSGGYWVTRRSANAKEKPWYHTRTCQKERFFHICSCWTHLAGAPAWRKVNPPPSAKGVPCLMFLPNRRRHVRIERMSRSECQQVTNQQPRTTPNLLCFWTLSITMVHDGRRHKGSVRSGSVRYPK